VKDRTDLHFIGAAAHAHVSTTSGENMKNTRKLVIVILLIILVPNVIRYISRQKKTIGEKSVAMNQESIIQDNSIHIDTYNEIALPGINKTWDAKDYFEIAGMATGLAEKDRSLLPRFQSERSGKLFSKIISEDNFRTLYEEGLPLEDRYSELIEYYKALGMIISCYVSNGDNNYFDNEIVSILGLYIKATSNNCLFGP